MKKNLRRIFIAASTFLLGILIIWSAGFFLFANKIKSFTTPPTTVHTDAIVVLTGGAERINTGLDLLQSGSAEKLLISGVDERVTLDKIMSMWKGHINNPDCCIFIGHMAQNTRENAAETRQWADQMYVRSLRLVTSSYHMPRAIAEFHAAMPDIKILPHPVIPGRVEASGWKNPPLIVMANEYNKAILGSVRTAFLDNKNK